MPTWIRESSRWAIYLRDGLRCVYCGVTAAGLVADPNPENFLTLDHFKTRKAAGDNTPANLITCCYRCNRTRGNRTIKDFSLTMGWNYGAVRSRVLCARRRDVDLFREAAAVLLGEYDGIARADLVSLMTWRSRRQWAGEGDRAQWEGGIELCSACHRVSVLSDLDSRGEDPPF